ncbi:hypothetical protein PG997_014805 [Apiospora hydei]|uniref:BZIP domain-containing protein n=1 Tax=Apiospora hydei TaxID=1337664 RepID=A0ABR1UUV5_9PEZI
MDADQELKRRRERGRQAQAAFRKRQAKAAQSVQEENKSLREAIESIIHAANRSDRPGLLQVIREAAAAAGIEAKHLEASTSTSDDITLSADAREVGFPSNGCTTDTNITAIGSTLVNAQPSKSRAASPVTWSTTNRPPVTIGNFWFDPLRSTNITTTHQDVVPYVGQGRYTLGGLLFWGVLDHVTNACTHRHHPRSCEELKSLVRRTTAHSKSLSRVRPEFINSLAAKARQQYLQNGYVDDRYAPATEWSSLAAMRSMVDEDYASKGRDTSAWLLPKDVEGRVRRGLGREMFDRLEQAARAPESSQAHRALKETIHKMVDAFMCFGNGPSWQDSFVDTVFTEWALLKPH